MSYPQKTKLLLPSSGTPAVCVSSGHRQKYECVIFQRFGVYFFYTAILISIAKTQVVPIIGRVVDATTHMGVSYAVVLFLETGEKKESDEEGYFQFTVRPVDRYILAVHHIAYMDAEHTIVIEGHRNDTVTIVLQQKIFQTEGIVVHSTRTLSGSVNSPFPLDITTSKDLQRHNNTTISDGLKTSPGISLVRDGSWETAISIRGMSRSNIIGLVDNARIETANDIAGALSLFNANDVERVETIRSSGAALYGTGALGGIVHFITKRSSFSDDPQWHGEMNSGISSVNNCTSQYIAINGSSKGIAGRISFGYRKADNTKTPLGALPNSQFTDLSINGSLVIKSFGKQSIVLSYQRSQGENSGISGGSAISDAAMATYRLMKRELLQIEYMIPEIIESVLFTTIRVTQQNIVRNVEIVQSPTVTLTPHAVHSTASGQIESKIHITANNYLVLGAEIWQRTLESKRERINTADASITGERPIPHSRFLSAGIYGQNEWHILPEKTTLLFGARYDRIYIGNDETKNPEYLISNGVMNISPAHQQILWKSGTATNDSWSANAGIRHALHHDFDVTFLASTAFRSPTLEERYQYLTLGDGIHVGNPDLQPERSVSINAGLHWHTEGMMIKTDLFLNHLTNLVAEIPGLFEGNAAFSKTNIAGARLYGYEISGEYSLTSWSALTTSVSYVRGENSDSHTNLPDIAPLRGTLEISVQHQNAGTMFFSSTFCSSQKYIGAGETETAGYGVFDIDAVSIPLSINRFSFVLRGGIQNVFDASYRNHLSTLRGIITAEPGRNFFLSVTVSA